MKVIKQVIAKGKNVRIIIELVDKDNSRFFLVSTKRLQDFKSRKISETLNTYSLETFLVLTELSSSLFFNDSFISNKVLLKDLDKLRKESKFSVNTWVDKSF